MCLQCLTEVVCYCTEEEQEVLPRWYLVQATKDYFDEWKAGEWGLVRCNNPDTVWEGKIYKEPNLTEEEKDKSEEWWNWHREVIKIENALDRMSFQATRDFLNSASTIGAPIEENSLIISEWLMNHLANWIETHPARKD